MVDRRISPRLSIFLEAAYRADGSSSHVRAQIGNLSVGGAALLSKEPIEPDTKFSSIRFALPGKGGESVAIEALGMAVHTSPPSGGRDHHLTGVDFLELKEHELDAIKRFVLARLRRQAAVGKKDTPSPRLRLEQPIAIRYGLFKDFVREVSSNLSRTGMFIQTADPRPPGSVFDFQFQLGDDFTLVDGRAEVVWQRTERQGPDAPVGMGVRFLDVEKASVSVIEQLVSDHEDSGHQPFDLEAGSPERPLPLAAPNAHTQSQETSALPIAEPGKGGTEQDVDLGLRVRQLQDEATRLRQDAEWQNLEHLKEQETLRKQLEGEAQAGKLLELELTQARDTGPAESLQSEIESLESARTELEEALLHARDELRETRAAADKERAALSEELNRKALAYEDAAGELEQAHGAASTSAERTIELEATLEEAKERERAQTDRIKDLLSERDSLNTRLDQFAAFHSELESEFLSERDMNRVEHDELKTNHQNVLTSLNETLSSQGTLEDELAELTGRLKESEGEKIALAEVIAERDMLAKALEALESERDDLETQFEELSRTSSLLTEEIEQLGRDAQVREDDAQQSKQKRQREFDRLLQEAGNREKKLAHDHEKAQRLLENVEGERDALAAENEEFKIARRDAAQSLDKLAEEKQKLSEQLSSHLEDFEARESADKENLAQQVLAVAGFEKRNEGLAQSLAAADQEVETLRTRVQELETAATRFTTTPSEEFQEENQELTRQLAEAESARDTLAASLDSYGARTSRAESLLAAAESAKQEALTGHPLGVAGGLTPASPVKPMIPETASVELSIAEGDEGNEGELDLGEYIPEDMTIGQTERSKWGWAVTTTVLLGIAAAMVGWRYFDDQLNLAQRETKVTESSSGSSSRPALEQRPRPAVGASSVGDPATSGSLGGEDTDVDLGEQEPSEPEAADLKPVPSTDAGDANDAIKATDTENANDPAGAGDTVKDWAAAWSAQRPEEYLGFYDAEFRSVDGETKASWAAQRRPRITGPNSIRVSVTNLVSSLDSDGTARVTFHQVYQSDTFRDEVTKTLLLVRRGDAWKIISELAE